MPMIVYIALAPLWAQALAQPPPEPKLLTVSYGSSDQRTVMASGQLGAPINAYYNTLPGVDTRQGLWKELSVWTIC